MDVRLSDLEADTPRNAPQRYAFYLTVELVNRPGSKRLFGVRYYGTLRFAATVNGSLRTYEPSADYDSSILDALSGGVTSLEDIEAQAQAFLNGRVVNPINVGGRWIVR